MPSTGWVRRDLDVRKISDLYFSDRMSSKDIAKIYKTSPQTIRRFLRDQDLHLRSTSEANLVRWGRFQYREVPISEKQDQIIIGTLLGDGGLSIQASSVNPTFSVGHREADKEYLLWKHQELESTTLFRNPPFPREKKMNGKVFRRWVIRSIQHPILKDYMDLMYKEKTSIISLRALERLGLLGLAIYYLDDGGLRNNRSPCLYTYGYQEDEILLLRYFIDSRWEMKFELKEVKYGRPKKKGHVLVLSKDSLPRFRELIIPYILPITCMHRKIP